MRFEKSTRTSRTRATRLTVAFAAAGLGAASLAPLAPAAQASPAASAAHATPSGSAPTVAAAAPSVSAAPTATVVTTGAPVRVSGRLAGVPAGSKVALQRLDGRTWRTVTSVTTARSGSSAGRYTVRVPSSSPGRFFYRVASVPTRTQRVGTSRPFTLAVGRGNPKSVAYFLQPIARWDPCTPIRYRVNLEGAPKGAAADIDRAIAQVAAGSGLRFRRVGTTTIVPGSQGRDVQDTYPAGTDLVLAFARPGDPRKSRRSSYLQKGSDIVGVGGAFYRTDAVRASGRPWHQIVQGYVVLDRTKKLPSGFGAGKSTGLLGTWGQVLMHELGHVVGLDHPAIKDSRQIMYASTTTKTAVWGAGDLTGLRTVGSASGCLSGSARGAMSAGTQKAAETLTPVERTGH